MSIYTRTTRICPVGQIDPELLRVIRAYFQSHDLGDIETETQQCCETVSEKKVGNWLAVLDSGADSTVHTAILFTAAQLIWARRGDEKPAHVRGADLALIRVKPYYSLVAREGGLEISGIMDDSRMHMHGQISLGPQPAAEEFCEEVQRAIEKINPKPTRKWPTWMGGGQ